MLVWKHNWICFANLNIQKNWYRAYQKKMAIRSRGKSPRIAARTAIFNSKKNGDPSRDQSRRIASRSAPRKEMASTFMPSRSPQNIVFRVHKNCAREYYISSKIASSVVFSAGNRSPRHSNFVPIWVCISYGILSWFNAISLQHVT